MSNDILVTLDQRLRNCEFTPAEGEAIIETIRGRIRRPSTFSEIIEKAKSVTRLAFYGYSNELGWSPRPEDVEFTLEPAVDSDGSTIVFLAWKSEALGAHRKSTVYEGNVFDADFIERTCRAANWLATGYIQTMAHRVGEWQLLNVKVEERIDAYGTSEEAVSPTVETR